MWPAWLSSIKKIVIQESKDTLHKPGISEIIAVMDKHQFEVYTKIYVDAKYGALVFKGSQAIEGQEKKDWEKETLIFCRDNSEYPYTPVLKTMYEEKSTPIANTKAPTFKLRNAKGKKVSLKKMKGKYVVLDVWGSWCGPCRLANKELVTLYKKYASDKLVFLSVAYDKNKEDWEKTIETDGLLWTQLLYSPEFLDDYKVYAFPTVFIIGPDGKILKRSNTVSDEELKILTETINKN
ncbi:MAG: TlpA family protein disulfide reductase [Bacteroidia bacterium]|nr:TlpA family protein disulfide reductase [Bacteroidia bacterium]